MSFDFLYQKKAILPPEYISKFHKYWEQNHGKPSMIGLTGPRSGSGGGVSLLGTHYVN